MYKYLIFLFICIHLLFSQIKFIGFIDKENEKFNLKNMDSLTTASKPVYYKNGMLFTFFSKEAKKIYVSSDFFSWDKIQMFKNKKNIFCAFLKQTSFKKGQYRYRYLVDSFWVDDPNQDYYVNEKIGFPVTGFEFLNDSFEVDKSPKDLGGGYFSFFLEDHNYKYVSWVGNKNNWDPYVDIMKKEKNVWMITLKIDKNISFYKFYVDGKFILDSKNSIKALNEINEVVNYIPNDLILKSYKKDVNRDVFLSQ